MPSLYGAQRFLRGRAPGMDITSSAVYLTGRFMGIKYSNKNLL